MPPTARYDARLTSGQVADLLTPDEREVVREAYGVTSSPEMAAMQEAVPCGPCFIPAALRPPWVDWPSCDCHQPVAV